MKNLCKALLYAGILFGVSGLRCFGQEVSGDYYDWLPTMEPERPWLHNYSQTVVMKMHLCDRDADGNVSKVYLNFSDALEVIKKLDNVTLGIPKIIYLVGWQFNGHDSKYPSWNKVNERLKRPEDKNAEQSLKWLMVEARKYHTTVSLHINMIDAYKDSPLWETYDKNNIILKDNSGEPIQGEVHGGMQSYQISYAQEWRTGFAQKRIDELLQILPELKEAGTIHIDAFHSIQPVRPAMEPTRQDSDQLSSPYLGLTVEDEIAAQRKIIRYWRAMGLDVTTEGDTNHLKPDPFIGLVPMAWWYDPAAFTMFDWLHKPADFVGLPPRLYSGTPMHAEEEILRDPQHLEGLAQQFCEKVVPWYYANNAEPKEVGFNWTPNEYGVFVPALWLPATIVACGMTESGPDSKSIESWRLPQSWGKPSSVKMMRITPEGLEQQAILRVSNNTIELPLKAGEVYAIQK
jgi:hypothetical protein